MSAACGTSHVTHGTPDNRIPFSNLRDDSSQKLVCITDYKLSKEMQLMLKRCENMHKCGLVWWFFIYLIEMSLTHIRRTAQKSDLK